MEYFLIVIFLINYGFCCEIHNNCAECVNDLTDCFWTKGYTGEFFCAKGDDEGVYIVTECFEHSTSTRSPVKKAETPTLFITTPLVSNGGIMTDVQPTSNTFDKDSEAKRPYGTQLDGQEYSPNKKHTGRHLRASPEINFQNLSRRMTKRIKRNFCHSVRLLQRVNVKTQSTTMNYFLKRNPMLKEADVCEKLIEARRLERQQLGFGQQALALAFDCHSHMNCLDCVNNQCLWVLNNDKTWCSFNNDTIPANATFVPAGAGIWCPATPNPDKTTTWDFYFYGFWIQSLFFIFALGFIIGKIWKKSRTASAADEAIPLNRMN